MNPFVRQYVNHKINNLTVNDLLKLSEVCNIKISREQAKKLLLILTKEPFDVGNEQQKNRILKQIGTEINKDIEKKLRYLLDVMI